MGVRTSFVILCWMSLVCIAPVTDTTAYEVVVTVVRGEYGGQTVLRCSLSPKCLSIKFVEWHDTSANNDSPAYFDGAGIKNNKNRGRFIGRNVTGIFNKGNSYHELIFYESKTEDEGNYTCHANAETETHWVKGQTTLKLFVSPQQPPGIFDKRKKIKVPSNCTGKEQIPRVPVDGWQDFFCRVEGSDPGAVITWNFAGHHGEHTTSYSPEYKRNGRLVRDAEQKIEVHVWEENILQCTVKVPIKGAMTSVSLCVKLRPVASKRILLYGILPGAFFILYVLVRLVYCRFKLQCERRKLLNEAKTSRHLFIVSICAVNMFRHTCLGIIALIYTSQVCRSIALGLIDEHAVKQYFTIAISGYCGIHILLDVLYFASFLNTKVRQSVLNTQPNLGILNRITVYIVGPARIFLRFPFRNLQTCSRNNPTQTETQRLSREPHCCHKGSQTKGHSSGHLSETAINDDADETVINHTEYTDGLELPEAVRSASFASDLIMSIAYQAGFLWNTWLPGECYWDSASMIWLVLCSYVGCAIWLVICIAYANKMCLYLR